MNRFFFDTTGPTGHVRDEEGCDCVSGGEAERLADRALLEIAASDCAENPPAAYRYAIRVRDAAGEPVYKATLTMVGTRL